MSVDYNLMDHSCTCGERKVIKHVAEEKDLGIWCTANLKPTAQQCWPGRSFLKVTSYLLLVTFSESNSLQFYLNKK